MDALDHSFEFLRLLIELLDASIALPDLLHQLKLALPVLASQLVGAIAVKGLMCGFQQRFEVLHRHTERHESARITALNPQRNADSLLCADRHLTIGLPPGRIRFLRSSHVSSLLFRLQLSVES